jgi:hypothetical protein
MENSENPNPQEKKSLDDSLKLAIREEIEKEVEKRIQKQEGFYWKFLALFGGFVAVFAYALWHVQLNELPGVVQKELATQEVTKAKDRIMEIKSSVETANQNVNAASTMVSNILNSVTDNQQAFTNRLNEIKQQDNVVLSDDISKLFVVQTVTNLNEIDASRKISLDYEPIPQTFNIFMNEGRLQIGNWRILGYIDKNTFIITNNTAHMTSAGGVKFLQIEYVRKSLR